MRRPRGACKNALRALSATETFRTLPQAAARPYRAAEGRRTKAPLGDVLMDPAKDPAAPELIAVDGRPPAAPSPARVDAAQRVMALYKRSWCVPSGVWLGGRGAV